MVRQKNIFILFMMICCIAMLSGCTSNNVQKPMSSKKSSDITKIELKDKVWGEVSLSDKVILKNIGHFMSTFSESKIKPSNLIFDGAIDCVIFYEGGKQEHFFFNKDWAFNGKQVYDGSGTTSVFAMLEKELFSKEQIIKLVRRSKVFIEASDYPGKRLVVPNTAGLITCLSQLERFIDKGVLQVLQPQYPNFQIVVEQVENKPLKISVIDNEILAVTEGNRNHVFQNSGLVWKYCSENLVLPKPDVSHVRYLFLSNRLVSSASGDISNKKLPIARLLLKGQLIEQKNISTKSGDDLTFTFNGNEKVTVKVTEDYFVFNGKAYFLPNLKRELERIIAAG